MPIAPYAMIPETPDGRNRIFAAPPSIKDQELRSSCALPADAHRFPFGWRLAVSVQDSPIAANTTSRRQEVDESWTYFNVQLIIDLQR